MFAAYDQMANPAVFHQVLAQLPTQKQKPVEMCQLIVKDFEMCFGKLPQSATEIEKKHMYRTQPVNQMEYEDSPIKLDYPSRRDFFGIKQRQVGQVFYHEKNEGVMPFIRKQKDKILFVNAYLLP